jgi:diadenosine tetraphosphate (Ap4A) HIT family hydrolase
MNALIWESEYFTLSQSGEYRVPGYLLLHSKRKVELIADFSWNESTELMRCLALAERLLQELLAPERIYISKFGEVNPQIHFHVLPRTEQLGLAFTRQTGATEPYNGARLMDWIWNQPSGLGYTPDEIAGFVADARDWVKTLPLREH